MMGMDRGSLYKEISASQIQVRKAYKKTLIAIYDIHKMVQKSPRRLK
jgi:hypothetical protein